MECVIHNLAHCTQTALGVDCTYWGTGEVAANSSSRWTHHPVVRLSVSEWCCHIKYRKYQYILDHRSVTLDHNVPSYVDFFSSWCRNWSRCYTLLIIDTTSFSQLRLFQMVDHRDLNCSAGIFLILEKLSWKHFHCIKPPGDPPPGGTQTRCCSWWELSPWCQRKHPHPHWSVSWDTITG